MRSKKFLKFNSNIMVGYARHNIHFRKSCAHFKIFNSFIKPVMFEKYVN